MAKSTISLFIRSCSLPTGVEEERAKGGVSLFLSLLCVLVFYSYLCPITIQENVITGRRWGGGGSVQCINQSINQSALFKHGKWLSKLVFRHAV